MKKKREREMFIALMVVEVVVVDLVEEVEVVAEKKTNKIIL